MELNEVVARGHFWLEDANSAIAGELKYTPKNGTTLYLFGALEEIPFARSEVPTRYPFVRGYTETLGWVSLLEAVVTRQQFGTRPTASEIHSNMVIHSSSANDFTAVPILKLTAEIDCLHEWVGISGFSHKWSADFMEVEVGFRAPDALRFDFGDDEVGFVFGRKGPALNAVQKEMTISQSTRVSIAFSKAATLPASLERLLAIKDLISLGVGRSLSWKAIGAKFAAVSTEPNGAWASILDRPTGAPCDETVHPAGMLFAFQDVKHRFHEVLSAWMRIGEELKPLYTLYSATTRGQTLYSEHRLFNFFQALESYHRMRFGVNEETTRRANVIREKISASCSTDEKDWVKDKLQHLGEPSAAERIRALIEKFDGKWIFAPDWEGAVKRIKNLRNYFTHYSKRPSAESLDSASIYNDGSRLQVLCEQILLVEIGFQPSESSSLLQKHCRLQRLMVS